MVAFHLIHVTVNPDQKTYPGVTLISYSFKEQVYIPFINEPGAQRPALDTAQNYLQQKGFNLLGFGMGANDSDNSNYFIITDAWKSIK